MVSIMKTTITNGGGVALTIVFTLLALSGCSSSIDPQRAQATIQKMLEKAVTRDKKLGNAVLLVDAPRLGVEGTWAAGVADERSGEPNHRVAGFGPDQGSARRRRR